MKFKGARNEVHRVLETAVPIKFSILKSWSESYSRNKDNTSLPIGKDYLTVVMLFVLDF